MKPSTGRHAFGSTMIQGGGRRPQTLDQEGGGQPTNPPLSILGLFYKI